MPRIAYHLVCCLLLWLGAQAPALAERSWQEIARGIEIAQGNIAQAQKVIGGAEQKAQAAVDKVKNADHFEGPQWTELEKAMQDYANTFQQQTKIIDSNVRTILKLDPAANLPNIEFNPPMLRPTIREMEDVRDELKRTVQRAKNFKAARQQDRAKVALEMEQSTEEAFKQTVIDALDAPVNTDGSIKYGALIGVPINNDGSIDYDSLLSAFLPLPAKVAATGMKVGFGLYFYAEEMKSGVMQIKTFKDQIAYADLAIERAQANVQSAEQGLKLLDGYWNKKEELMKSFYQLRNAWSGLADQSRQEIKREEAKEFEQEMAKPKLPASNSNYDPPLQATEVEPEANAALRELRSAADAAMQGGDPDGYWSILMSKVTSYSTQTEKARAAVKQASDAYSAAAQTVRQTVDRIWENYWAMARGRCWCDPALRAAAEAANRASQQAYASLTPYNTALNRAHREQARIYMVINLVSNGSYRLQQEMSQYAARGSANLSRSFQLSVSEFREILSEMYAARSQLPDRYQIEYMQRYLAELDERIQHDLFWGYDPAGIRAGILAYAENVRQTGETARRQIPEYKRSLLVALQAAKQYKNDLNALLDKDAMLMASAWDGSLSYMYWPWSPESAWHREGDQRKQRIADWKRYIEDGFKFDEKADIDFVGSFDYNGLARQIEAKAEGLQDLVSRLETYRYRLGMMNSLLEPVSRKLTGQPLYRPRSKPALTLVEEEMNKSPWSGISSAADAAVSKETRALAKASIPLYAAGYGPRPHLLAAQNALLQAAQVQMKNNLSSRNYGGFVPVPESDFKPLAEQWAALKPIYEQFDAQAASARARIQEIKLPNTSMLYASYQAIPERQRYQVQGPHQNFLAELRYLNDYLIALSSSLEPIGDISRNNVKGMLEELIGGYPKALQDYKEREERQRREYEEASKRAEQERVQRSEKENNGIRSLYQNFVNAYQSRNLRGLLSYMHPQWQAADGTSLIEFEDTLANSFRVFDSITFAISGMSVRQLSPGSYEVSYEVVLTGRISRRNIKHEERGKVVDIVDFLPEGPVISRTSGSAFMIK